MYSFRFPSFVSLLLGLCLAAPAVAQVGRDTSLWEWSVKAGHHESIVKVESGGGAGTGVIVRIDTDKPVADGFEGWCLTAWHVVADDAGRRQIRVEYRNGRSAKNCKVLAFSEEHDVALIWVWVPPTVPAVAVATRPVLPHHPIEIAGLGGGSRLQCCLRHFQTIASAPTSDTLIYADVTLLPGDSGGPVFNRQHEVTGIVSGGWFWWDGGVLTESGHPIKVTWPARTCNLKPILDLLAKASAADANQVVSR